MKIHVPLINKLDQVWVRWRIKKKTGGKKTNYNKPFPFPDQFEVKFWE
jgi:hypothetical protein